jgi:hypothetical protein
VTRTRLRFRAYDLTPLADSAVLPAARAVCVTGADADCGAASPELTDGAALTRWLAEHCRDTGHESFELLHRTALRVTPGHWQ